MKSSANSNSASSSHRPRAPPWVTARAISATYGRAAPSSLARLAAVSGSRVSGVVEKILRETEHAAAEDVQGVMRLGDREATFAEDAEHRVDVLQHSGPGRGLRLHRVGYPRMPQHDAARGEH